MTTNLSAIELLNLGDSGRKKPWINQYWPHVLGVGFGVIVGSFLNYQTRRPPFSGIQKHIVFSAGFTYALVNLTKYRESYYEEKDAVLRHYIELHKEDFIVPERKKLADVLEPWIPIR